MDRDFLEIHCDSLFHIVDSANCPIYPLIADQKTINSYRVLKKMNIILLDRFHVIDNLVKLIVRDF